MLLRNTICTQIIDKGRVFICPLSTYPLSCPQFKLFFYDKGQNTKLIGDSDFMACPIDILGYRTALEHNFALDGTAPVILVFPHEQPICLKQTHHSRSSCRCIAFFHNNFSQPRRSPGDGRFDPDTTADSARAKYMPGNNRYEHSTVCIRRRSRIFRCNHLGHE